MSKNGSHLYLPIACRIAKAPRAIRSAARTLANPKA
jgi:hypothetical protein